MVKNFIVLFLFTPFVAFAHEVGEDVLSKESHMVAHIMEAIFAMGIAFAFFVVYLIYKDYKKSKEESLNDHGTNNGEVRHR